MNTLLTFDSTLFVSHLVKDDDKKMVNYIIQEYGPALQEGLNYNGSCDLHDLTIDEYMRNHYTDAYLKALMCMGNPLCDMDTQDVKIFIKRTVDDDGVITSTKARYDELVESCINHFNSQVVAVLRGIKSRTQRIYTVEVLGYENRTLKILLKTDGKFQP